MASKRISAKQALAIVGVLMQNSDWDDLDPDLLQRWVIRAKKTAGRHFTEFLKNGGRVTLVSGGIIPVDRSLTEEDGQRRISGPFCKLKNVERHTLNLFGVRFETAFRAGESEITPKESASRLMQSGAVLLDGCDMVALLEHQHLIPEEWKKLSDGRTRRIMFLADLPGEHKAPPKMVSYMYFEESTGAWMDASEFGDCTLDEEYVVAVLRPVKT